MALCGMGQFASAQITPFPRVPDIGGAQPPVVNDPLTSGAINDTRNTLASVKPLFAAKARAMGWGNPLPATPEPTRTQAGPTSRYISYFSTNATQGYYQTFERGNLYYDTVRQTVFPVPKRILDAWGTTGWEHGPLGFPISDIVVTFAPFWRGVFFEGGLVMITQAGETVILQRNTAISEPGGDIGAALNPTVKLASGLTITPGVKGKETTVKTQTSVPNGGLGLPLSGEVVVKSATEAYKNDRAQFFQFGIAYWRATSRKVDLLPLTGPTKKFPTSNANFKITLNSFRCNHETADDILEGDGRRDEIQVGGVTRVFKNGLLERQNMRTSVSFGDANRFSTQAGTGGDKGGIRTGDIVANLLVQSRREPFILFAGNMAQGVDAVQIIPMIWECDSRPKPMNGLTPLSPNLFGSETELPEALQIVESERSKKNPSITYTPEGFRFTFRKLIAEQLWRKLRRGPDMLIDAGVPGTRPIGFVWTTEGYAFNPQGALFDFDMIEALMNNDLGYGKGILPVNYTDDARLGGGDYTLYLQFEKA